MKKVVQFLVVILLFGMHTSCYTYKEVPPAEVNQKDKSQYRVTTIDGESRETTFFNDSVYLENDTVWIRNQEGIKGYPVEEVAIAERKFSWGKFLLLIVVPPAVFISIGLLILSR